MDVSILSLRMYMHLETRRLTRLGTTLHRTITILRHYFYDVNVSVSLRVIRSNLHTEHITTSYNGG